MVSRSRILLTTAFLLWIAFVLAAYYAVQKPIMPWDANDLEGWASAFEHAPTLDGIGVSLLNLATALAIGLAALLAGTRLVPLTYPGEEAPLRLRAEYWLLGTGVGFGAIGIVMLAL